MSTEAKSNAVATPSVRLFSLVVLTLVVSAVAWSARQIHEAVTDSFVAPIIFTPDNDAVISSKLSLSQLEVERARTAAEIDAIDNDTAAGLRGLERLRALRDTVSHSLSWARSLNQRLAHKSAAELSALDAQAALLRRMIGEQERIAGNANDNLKHGLVAQSDAMRESLALGQLKVALLENRRSREEGEAEAHEVKMAQSALARRGHAVMPEQILREDQLVRIELEILKLESEQRTKRAERSLLADKLARINELQVQLKSRPIFRAAAQSLDVAFVPYTQMHGVAKGAEVYHCTWGLVDCRLVGSVSELVKGEVILPDPWGNQARGQYVLLELTDHSAAESKTLRVRSVR